ncbi:suppression of tumorigenicity 5 st5 [Anaeramoeba ignava]|uniref:Suppression of tumorigenicity 5 st5 n=1 Tax=Anaeramoeba ignava TaxID=1746090 RepID=A0A9Q0LE99_ANAIG|nr:suppression of tumorigenicity 5 st5 [Anaeramoeba ignava]
MNKIKLFERFYILSLKKYSQNSLINTSKEISKFVSIPFSFPSIQKDDFREKIKPFCFPDASTIKTEQNSTENFTFVLTEGLGVRTYGISRRLLKKDSQKIECLTFITKFPLFNFFYQILEKVELKKNIDSSSMVSFVKMLYQKKIPKPGDTLKLVLPETQTLPQQDISIKRLDTLLGDYNLYTIFSVLDSRLILCLFSSLLFERRIIFTSSSLGAISNTILASIALLQPFQWHHIFIPILPETLIDTACSPMPIITGIHNSLLPILETLPLDEVVVVDLDNNSIEFDPADIALIPTHRATKLIRTMKKQQSLLRNYSFFMKFNEQTKSFEFDFESFSSSKQKATKKFLDAFQHTQMFEVWCREREIMANGGEFSENDTFETRLSDPTTTSTTPTTSTEKQQGKSFGFFSKKKNKKPNEDQQKTNGNQIEQDGQTKKSFKTKIKDKIKSITSKKNKKKTETETEKENKSIENAQIDSNENKQMRHPQNYHINSQLYESEPISQNKNIIQKSVSVDKAIAIFNSVTNDSTSTNNTLSQYLQNKRFSVERNKQNYKKEKEEADEKEFLLEMKDFLIHPKNKRWTSTRKSTNLNQNKLQIPNFVGNGNGIQDANAIGNQGPRFTSQFTKKEYDSLRVNARNELISKFESLIQNSKLESETSHVPREKNTKSQNKIQKNSAHLPQNENDRKRSFTKDFENTSNQQTRKLSNPQNKPFSIKKSQNEKQPQNSESKSHFLTRKSPNQNFHQNKNRSDFSQTNEVFPQTNHQEYSEYQNYQQNNQQPPPLPKKNSLSHPSNIKNSKPPLPKRTSSKKRAPTPEPKKTPSFLSNQLSSFSKDSKSSTSPQFPKNSQSDFISNQNKSSQIPKFPKPQKPQQNSNQYHENSKKDPFPSDNSFTFQNNQIVSPKKPLPKIPFQKTNFSNQSKLNSNSNSNSNYN